jgi:glycine cleavage system aminomethyltransferase T
MKSVALNDTHIALGAKMVPFAGFNMPVQYSGINIEHETVRNGVGVFDVSHMGEFILKGEGAWILSKVYVQMMLLCFLTGKFSTPAFQMRRWNS